MLLHLYWFPIECPGLLASTVNLNLNVHENENSDFFKISGPLNIKIKKI